MNHRNSIILLMSGSAAAQLIGVIASPILTRLYTPEDFGMLALYLAVCNIIAVFATGRYDLAIIEPAKNEDARGLLIASMQIAIIFSVILAGIILLGANVLNMKIKFIEYHSLLLMPITVFNIACTSIFTYWLNRLKNFTSMNVLRLTSAISITGLSILFALIETKGRGLILGYVIGQTLSITCCWFMYVRKQYHTQNANTMDLLIRYVRYPKFLIPSTLAGSMAAEAPIILMSRIFDTTISGFFSFAIRVTVSPMSIVGSSIGEAYRIKAAEHYNVHGQCRDIFIKHFMMLFAIGLIPFTILYIWGPYIFGLVFGEQWIQAGEIAASLSFVVWMQLVSSPLSYTITFNRSQHLDLGLQIFRLVGVIFSLMIGGLYNDYMLGINLFCLTCVLYYISHSMIQFKAARGS
jgi:O-antigen/teichoic acid export membrane protein